MVFRIYLCDQKPYLIVIVVKRGRSHMCPMNHLLYEIYRKKTLLSALNFDFKKRTREIFEILISDIWMGIVFILSRKKCEVTVEIFKRVYLKVWKYVKWVEVPKIRVKCFIPLTKVNFINFYFDQNILHQSILLLIYHKKLNVNV